MSITRFDMRLLGALRRGKGQLERRRLARSDLLVAEPTHGQTEGAREDIIPFIGLKHVVDGLGVVLDVCEGGWKSSVREGTPNRRESPSSLALRSLILVAVIFCRSSTVVQCFDSAVSSVDRSCEVRTNRQLTFWAPTKRRGELTVLNTTMPTRSLGLLITLRFIMASAALSASSILL